MRGQERSTALVGVGRWLALRAYYCWSVKPRSVRAGGGAGRVAALYLYLSSVQYFVAQLLVAQRYVPRYSWMRNTISDLGSTSCRHRDAGPCSPLHSVMNGSFVLLGLSMIVGSLLLGSREATAWARTGFAALAVSGVGTALVGVAPENRVPALHAVSASLPFVVGNLGVLILGGALRVNRAFRLYSVVTGVSTLAALVLFVHHNYLGLGDGGMERIVAYPQTVWLVAFAVYQLVSAPGSVGAGEKLTTPPVRSR